MTYDLSTMQQSPGTYYVADTDDFAYEMNVCSNIQDSSNCSTDEGSICQYNSVNFTAVLASYTRSPEYQWALIDPANPNLGVSQIFENGDECNSGGNVYTTIINFLCADYADDTFTVQQAGCSYTMSIHNPAACPFFLCGDYTCVAQGESCYTPTEPYENTLSCQTTQDFCNEISICSQRPVLGATCFLNEGEDSCTTALQNLRCAADETCQPDLLPGDPCSTNDDCQFHGTETCVDGRCQGIAKNGECSPNSTYDCVPGLFCRPNDADPTTGTCQAAAVPGTPCSDSLPCTPGYICNYDTCVAMYSLANNETQAQSPSACKSGFIINGLCQNVPTVSNQYGPCNSSADCPTNVPGFYGMCNCSNMGTNNYQICIPYANGFNTVDYVKANAELTECIAKEGCASTDYTIYDQDTCWTTYCSSEWTSYNCYSQKAYQESFPNVYNPFACEDTNYDVDLTSGICAATPPEQTDIAVPALLGALAGLAIVAFLFWFFGFRVKPTSHEKEVVTDGQIQTNYNAFG